jgi:hypothetical protein
MAGSGVPALPADGKELRLEDDFVGGALCPDGLAESLTGSAKRNRENAPHPSLQPLHAQIPKRYLAAD